MIIMENNNETIVNPDEEIVMDYTKEELEEDLAFIKKRISKLEKLSVKEHPANKFLKGKNVKNNKMLEKMLGRSGRYSACRDAMVKYKEVLEIKLGIRKESSFMETIKKMKKYSDNQPPIQE
jgi:hypothetical protein